MKKQDWILTVFNSDHNVVDRHPINDCTDDEAIVIAEAYVAENFVGQTTWALNDVDGEKKLDNLKF